MAPRSTYCTRSTLGAVLLVAGALVHLDQLAGVGAAKVSDAPKLVGLLDELNNPEDTNATITCSVGSGEIDQLTYEWYRNKERIFSAADKIRIDIPAENYQSVLRIFNLKEADTGLYSCIARNRFGQDKISTKLNVRVQLKWVEQPTDTRASVGTALQVPCRAAGSPEPRVGWRRVGGDENLGGELRFAKLQPSDSGYYECRASNGMEEDLVARIKLDVLGEYIHRSSGL